MSLRLWIIKLFFILFFGFSLKAQNIRGIILDKSSSLPINGAVINLISNSDSLVFSFAFSNQSGFFSLKKSADSCLLKISHVGYDEIILDCKNIENNPDTLVFKLTIKQNQLNEVYVAAKRPMVVKGDTTFYRTESFKTGDEKNLEDLLKKIPNFNVDEDGKIYYKNKLIETIMINGDNLSGSNYEITTKTLSSEIINEVEAIENFEQNRILRTMKKGNQTVLNLKTQKIKNLGGLLSLNKGIHEHDLRSGIIGINKNIKTLLNGSYNNVGLKRFNADSKSLPWGSTNSWTNNQAISAPLKPQSYFYNNLGLQYENQNNEGVVNFSNNFNVSKKIQVNTQLIYSSNQLNSQKNNNNNVLLSQNELGFSQLDSTSNTVKNLRFNLGLEYDLNANNLLSIKYFLDKSSNNLRTNNFFNAFGLTSEIVQPMKLNNLHNIGLLEHTLKLNDKNVVKSSIRYFNKEDKTNLKISNGNIERKQENDIRQWFGEFESTWTSFKKNHESKTELLFSRKYFNLNQVSKEFSNQELNASIERQIMNYYVFGVKQNNSYKKQKVEIVSDIGLSFFNSLNSLQNNLTAKNLGFKGSYAFNNKNNIALNVSYIENPNWNNNLLTNPTILDFRTSQIGSENFGLNKELVYLINYNYLDVLKSKSSLNLTLFGVKYFQNIGFFNIDFIDFKQSLSLYNASNNYTVGIQSKFNQLIYKLRGNLRFDLSYNITGSENLFNKNLTFNKFQDFKGRINFQSKLNKFSFYEIEDETEYFNNLFDIYNIKRVSSFWLNTISLKSGISIKKMNFSVSMRNINTQNNSFTFFNSNLTFKIIRALNLNLDAYNVTNVMSYNLTRFSAIQRSDAQYGILGRIFLVGFNFNF